MVRSCESARTKLDRLGRQCGCEEMGRGLCRCEEMGNRCMLDRAAFPRQLCEVVAGAFETIEPLQMHLGMKDTTPNVTPNTLMTFLGPCPRRVDDRPNQPSHSGSIVADAVLLRPPPVPPPPPPSTHRPCSTAPATSTKSRPTSECVKSTRQLRCPRAGMMELTSISLVRRLTVETARGSTERPLTRAPSSIQPGGSFIEDEEEAGGTPCHAFDLMVGGSSSPHAHRATAQPFSPHPSQKRRCLRMR